MPHCHCEFGNYLLPAEFGEIAKMKVMPNKLSEAQLKIAQILEKKAKADKPKWCAIGRSPE